MLSDALWVDGLVMTLCGVPNPSSKIFSVERLNFFDRGRAGSVVRLVVLPEGGRTLTEGRTALELGGRGGRNISISATEQKITKDISNSYITLIRY